MFCAFRISSLRGGPRERIAKQSKQSTDSGAAGRGADREQLGKITSCTSEKSENGPRARSLVDPARCTHVLPPGYPRPSPTERTRDVTGIARPFFFVLAYAPNAVSAAGRGTTRHRVVVGRRRPRRHRRPGQSQRSCRKFADLA